MTNLSPVQQQSPTQRITVGIIKPSFDRNYKWEILFFETKQFAEVVDEDFLNTVAAGERFGSGDSLEVELELVQVWDKNIEKYITKEYRILKVYNHIPRAQQIAFNMSANLSSVDRFIQGSVEVAPHIQSLLKKED